MALLAEGALMRAPRRRACTSQHFLLARRVVAPLIPDRYEREIDEILRNMERTKPKPSLRERRHLGRRGHTQRPIRLRPRLVRSLHPRILSTSEWCFLAGIGFGLVAAGLAYPDGSGTALTGTLAVLVLLGIMIGTISSWRER